MFTGIIEKTGMVTAITQSGTNRTFWISSLISNELKIDQSLSHNGVCLTVEETRDGQHRVTAIEETLAKTNLGKWETGTIVNLERCMPMNGRLDGHIVQGHVDTVATCLDVVEKQGSWEYTFSFAEQFAPLLIEKGSISLNGISLTLFNVGLSQFSVAIIPYTYEHTNMNGLKKGDIVNIEFDMLGKYVNRLMQLR
ncbi:MAG: riboflavin synthase [Bacteroidetes bacterium]|nr:riboflavin synthase [Bacteroidota bacterium]